MPSLCSTIINSASSILKIDTSTTSHPAVQSSELLRVLNLANLEWLRSFRRGGGEPPTPLMREAGYTLIASTALAADITTSSTSITVDSSSGASSSGAFVIYDDGPDIGEFTGNSSNTLSGVTGLGYAHEDGDEVSFLYALPSNFADFRSSADSPYGVTVSGVPYIYTTGEPPPGHFSLYDNGTTKYLWFPRDLTGEATVSYNKSGTTLDDLADTVDVPADYDNFLVYRLVEHGFRALGADPSRAIEAKQVADRVLMEAHMEKNIGKKVRTRPFGRYTRRYYGVTSDFYPE